MANKECMFFSICFTKVVLEFSKLAPKRNSLLRRVDRRATELLTKEQKTPTLGEDLGGLE